MQSSNRPDRSSPNRQSNEKPPDRTLTDRTLNDRTHTDRPQDMKPSLVGKSFLLSGFLSANDSGYVKSLTTDQQTLFANFRTRLAQNKELNDFVSGVTGGVVATTTLHPLDVLKIRLAVNDGRSSTKRNYLGLRNAFKTIWIEEGVRGFYRGLVPNSLGAGLSWGLYFLFYNNLRKSQEENNRQTKSKDRIFSQSMLAAAEAGTLTLLLTNPIWVVKTRLCLQYGNNLTSKLPPEKQYSGMIDAFAKTYRVEGLKGLYSGFMPGLLNVTHGAIQFSIYEKLKSWHMKRNNLTSDSKITLEYIFYFSVVSKVCAASITYPLQVIRARLQDQHGHYANFKDAVVTTYRRESVRGFYKGFLPNAIRYVPASCITLMVVEHMSHKRRRRPEVEEASLWSSEAFAPTPAAPLGERSEVRNGL